MPDNPRVWVVTSHPYPMLPYIEQYEYLGDAKNGCYVKKYGSKLLVRSSKERTFCMTEQEFLLVVNKRMAALRQKHEEVGNSLDHVDANGLSIHIHESEEPEWFRKSPKLD